MPEIYDNINLKLSDALRAFTKEARSCSFCVGYLNLRGWDQLADLADGLVGGEEDKACRVLVGMYRPPEEEMKNLIGLKRDVEVMDGPTQAKLKRRITESFRQQLELGVPSSQAEQALRRLAEQLRARKVFIKAFLRYPLHAKLYLIRREDQMTPLIGFVGSSNLTLAGLSQNGELNVDVVEQDAAKKLLSWFDERWRDSLAIDLSETLADLIENSWASAELIRPYLVYLKIAQHLSEEARQGEMEFRLPSIFSARGTPLLPFQERAVSLAAHYLNRRGGVLLGDVVGLGKTLMAIAIARIFQEDDLSNTLVVCPPKLAPMWEQYMQTYEINGRVLSLGRVIEELGRADAPRYRLLVIDESHNLRNRESKRYRALRDYIERNGPRVLLLTATPYNKQFSDLANQLRLFLDEDQDLHVRPERFFQEWAESGKNEMDFTSHFQVSPCSLRAFEKSPFPEDWRDLMRMFLVRRTRQFIIRHYAEFDENRKRYYIKLNERPVYFPVREPKRIEYNINDVDQSDPYVRLFRSDIVEVIENLRLPRYGLAEYLKPDVKVKTEDNLKSGTKVGVENEEARVLKNLNRAGRRLRGFCRTNLFKRLESSGYSFLLSVKRHILRNLVTLHALENNLPLPIGTQDAALLDTTVNDDDEEFAITDETFGTTGNDAGEEFAITDETIDTPLDENFVVSASGGNKPVTLEELKKRAAIVYEAYAEKFQERFDWLSAKYFESKLKIDLEADTKALLEVLVSAGEWDPAQDAKLAELEKLLTERHPKDKVLIFTQFADTARYLRSELESRGVRDLGVVTNQTGDPVELVRRFSPRSNGGLRTGESELRVLIATDVLAEGQNLQDSHIIVNYDLPWAIIRLIQRAGRVDRIGQQHDTILVYSFLPADGVERIIRLRQRLFDRLRQNQEVIGTDETFFGEEAAARLRDLYTEKEGVLDDDRSDEEIDLASVALQVWKSASEADRKAAVALPPIVSATRALPAGADPVRNPSGVITYLRYPDGTDALIRVNERGELVSQSISAIFREVACAPDDPPLERAANHHELVARCVQLATEEQAVHGGGLGSPRSVRFKLYKRLNQYRELIRERPTLFAPETLEELDRVLDQVWRFPLKRAAQEAINRQMRLGISDEKLLELTLSFASENRLCEEVGEGDGTPGEPLIICSMGLAPAVTKSADTGDNWR